MQSVTEIQLNKLRAHFRARFAPMIWANCAPLNVWGGGDYYIGANQAGKRAHSLFNCISVTDGIKFLYKYTRSLFAGTVPYIYKSYKNHSRLNRYNFRTVHAIDFLFSPLHTTPFLYGKILFGVLHLLRARIATSDTPQSMNPS